MNKMKRKSQEPTIWVMRVAGRALLTYHLTRFENEQWHEWDRSQRSQNRKAIIDRVTRSARRAGAYYVEIMDNELMPVFAKRLDHNATWHRCTPIKNSKEKLK